MQSILVLLICGISVVARARDPRATCENDPAPIAALQRSLASERARISPRHEQHAHLNPLSAVPPIRIADAEFKTRRRQRRRPLNEPLAHLPIPAEYAKGVIKMNATVINWTVDPHTISDVKGGWVNVSFSNVMYPLDNDWIGLYSMDTDLTKFKAPLKFKYAYPDLEDWEDGSWQCGWDNATYWTEVCRKRHGPGVRCNDGMCSPAYGSTSFFIVNWRADVKFVYITGNIEFPDLVASTNEISFSHYNTPLGGHLHLIDNAHDATKMGFGWVCNNSDAPMVKFGTTPGGPYTFRSGYVTNTTYEASDMCDTETAPAGRQGWHDPGRLLNTTLENLTPGKRYYYIYGDETFDQWSPERSFQAPIPYGTPHATHIITFGDMGNAPKDHSWQHSFDFDNRGELPSLNTSAVIEQYVNGTLRDARGELVPGTGTVDFILDIGDVSYSVGYLSEWDAYMSPSRIVDRTRRIARTARPGCSFLLSAL